MAKKKQFCTYQVQPNNYGTHNCGKQAKFRLRFTDCFFCIKHAKNYDEDKIVDVDFPREMD